MTPEGKGDESEANSPQRYAVRRTVEVDRRNMQARTGAPYATSIMTETRVLSYVRREPNARTPMRKLVHRLLKGERGGKEVGGKEFVGRGDIEATHKQSDRAAEEDRR